MKVFPFSALLLTSVFLTFLVTLRAEQVKNPALAADLIQMGKEDQALREQYTANPKDKSLEEAYLAADAKHRARMEVILKANGWPTRVLIGEEGVQAAWLLVQHSPDLLDNLMPSLKAAADRGELTLEAIALSVDITVFSTKMFPTAVGCS